MSTVTNYEWSGAGCRKLLTGVLAAGLLLGLTACRTTHRVRGSVEESGFLQDYSQLHEGKSGQAKLVYIDPTADWAKYTKIDIEPVELWKSEDTNSPLGRLDQEDQKLLVDYAYTSLSNSLSKNFEIVNEKGPGVLVVRAAITEAKKCRPVSNLVSSVVPMGMGLSLVKRVIFGTGIGVGECQAEVELLDGVTGQRVAAAVDRRAGTKAIRTKFDGTFGDVKLALDYWSERLDERLVEMRNGQNNSEM
jgi:Protein of unknown function (DUF3313)